MKSLVFCMILSVGASSGKILKIEIGSNKDLKTLPEAVAKLAELRKISPGNTIEIVLNPGRYELSETLILNDTHSGTADAPVVWKSTGKAVISGARELRGFTAGADGFWYLKVPEGLKFEQLWINGQRATRARYPNAGTLSLQSVSEEKTADENARQTAKLDPKVFGSLLGKEKRLVFKFSFITNGTTRVASPRLSIPPAAS